MCIVVVSITWCWVYEFLNVRSRTVVGTEQYKPESSFKGRAIPRGVVYFFDAFRIVVLFRLISNDIVY